MNNITNHKINLGCFLQWTEAQKGWFCILSVSAINHVSSTVVRHCLHSSNSEIDENLIKIHSNRVRNIRAPYTLIHVTWEGVCMVSASVETEERESTYFFSPVNIHPKIFKVKPLSYRPWDNLQHSDRSMSLILRKVCMELFDMRKAFKV